MTDGTLGILAGALYRLFGPDQGPQQKEEWSNSGQNPLNDTPTWTIFVAHVVFQKEKSTPPPHTPTAGNFHQNASPKNRRHRKVAGCKVLSRQAQRSASINVPIALELPAGPTPEDVDAEAPGAALRLLPNPVLHSGVRVQNDLQKRPLLIGTRGRVSDVGPLADVRHGLLAAEQPRLALDDCIRRRVQEFPEMLRGSRAQPRHSRRDARKRLLPRHHAELGVLGDGCLAISQVGVADVDFPVLEAVGEWNLGLTSSTRCGRPVGCVQAVAGATRRTG